ncbi:MAG: NAD(P)/FAD-dependent oxidoreductase [Oscillospiraceae bacterium]|nr:NAD(P)/FAD-dependent oxidoreductase [Oscillospiraceae bacterium]
MYDVIVIGGGPAGMLASGVAAASGAKTLLLERNDKVGRKLLITGKGRCNLTNDCTVDEVLSNIPTGGKFLYSALNRFSPSDAMAFFASLGVPLKTERGGRVFPVSDRSSDVVGAIRNYMKNSGVMLKKGRAKRVIDHNEGFSVVTSSGEIDCGAIVLATGGKSYPKTGSTGDGYDIAKALGHSVTALRGSLVPLCAEPELCARMQGLALKNVRISVFDGGKKPIFEDFGELLFTHFGVSGPIVLSASAHMRDFESRKYYVNIDLKPALDEKTLDLRILRDFEKYKGRTFSNSLGELLSRSMIPAVVDRSGIPPEKKVHSISREERMGLNKLLKSFRIDIDGPRPVEEAIVTSGGILLSEITPKTMESKLVKGLYFAGEIIDADAYTGGYNLQIAWSTAYAAGTAVAGRFLGQPH